MRIVFLVHGMGVHPPKWSDAVRGKLDEVARRYAAFASGPRLDELVELHEISYDGVFEHHVEQMSADVDALEQFATRAGVALRKVPDWLRGASPKEQGFFWTHVVDVLLYRYFALVRDQVRLQVMLQIAGKLAATMRGGQIVDATVIAHSLGTSVVSDSLALLGSRPFNDSEAFLAGKGVKLKSVFTLANVSKELENDIDPYTSVLHPDSAALRPPSDAYCGRYFNFRHVLDPFCLRTPFAPAGWGSDLSSVDDLSHLHDFNVHGFEHYLDHPRVHIPIINGIFERPIVSAKERVDAVSNYPELAGECIDELVALKAEVERFAAPADVEDVVIRGAQFFALARAARDKCKGAVGSLGVA